MNPDPDQSQNDKTDPVQRDKAQPEKESLTDTGFHLLDKIALMVAVFGLGYLVLQNMPASNVIAWVLVTFGIGIKVLLRAL